KAPAARFPSAAALANAARMAAADPNATIPANAPVSPPPTAQVSPAGPRNVSQTQVLPPRTAALPQQRRAVPPRQPEPERSRAGVIVLGIILALLVMLLSGVVASLIKRHIYQNRVDNPHSIGAVTGGVAAWPPAARSGPTSVDSGPTR